MHAGFGRNILRLVKFWINKMIFISLFIQFVCFCFKKIYFSQIYFVNSINFGDIDSSPSFS